MVPLQPSATHSPFRTQYSAQYSVLSTVYSAVYLVQRFSQVPLSSQTASNIQIVLPTPAHVIVLRGRPLHDVKGNSALRPCFFAQRYLAGAMELAAEL